MRIELRIVAGSLRGRKLHCIVSEKLRPAPQRLREALFSILGNAVPDRAFYDLFAGTGAVGMEALSRGARSAVLIERDYRSAGAIEHHLRTFGVADQATVLRADVYRWGERWRGDPEPVNIFIGPPFADFESRPDDLLKLVANLQSRMSPGSVLILQSEDIFDDAQLPAIEQWDQRKYGRNRLLIWVKESEVRSQRSEVSSQESEVGDHGVSETDPAHDS